MNEAGRQLADLMNQQLEQRAGLPGRADNDSSASQHVAPTGSSDTQHLEKVAVLVCELLGARVKPWLQRKLRSQPQVIEDADDLGQLAALAFVEGYRQERIKPDPVNGQHTAASVSAYLWGICNKIFIDSVRRSRTSYTLRDEDGWQEPLHAGSPLAALLPGGPADDSDTQLWEVLAAVHSRCQPQDIVMAYLLGSGFNSGEVQRLLRVSINMPAKAIKRVGAALRELCGLEAGSGANKSASGRQASNYGNAAKSATPLALLQQKRFAELLVLLGQANSRNLLLSEAVAALAPSPNLATEQSLAARQFELRAAGDWSWGLLPPDARRALLLRDAKLITGAGFPDEGVAQQAAVKRLTGELGNIFEEFDKAVAGSDLEWLLPLGEHLRQLLPIVCEFKEMAQRYALLLETAECLGSPQLRFHALLGLGIGKWRLGQQEEGRSLIAEALELARSLDDTWGIAYSLNRLACVNGWLGEYATTLDLCEQALPLCRAIGNRSGEAGNLRLMANIYMELGDYDRALDLDDRATAIYLSLGDRYRALGNKGNIHYFLGEYGDAAAYFEQALAVMAEYQDVRGEGQHSCNLAEVHFALEQFSTCEARYLHALSIFRENGERSGERRPLGGLALLSALHGDYAQATELLSQAVNISRDLADRHGEAEYLGSLAIVRLAQGDLAGAREDFVLSLTKLAEILDRGDICRVCTHAAGWLARSNALQASAVVMFGVKHQAEVLGLGIGPEEKRQMSTLQDLFESWIGSKDVSLDQLEQWHFEGIQLDLPGLAHFAVTALQDTDLRGEIN